VLAIADRLAPVLSALSDLNRLAILLAISQQPRSVKGLTDAVGLPQTLVSHHLRALRDSGLVTAAAQGRSNVYTLCCAPSPSRPGCWPPWPPEAHLPPDRPGSGRTSPFRRSKAEEVVMTTATPDEIRSAVRDHYADAARTATTGAGPTGHTRSLYPGQQRDQLPEQALTAALGCGNPTLLTQLQPGQIVLDLGSGGGIVPAAACPSRTSC
jgi:hypothetical protein